MTEELIGNCIHLWHREDREQSIRKEAKEQGFYLRFWTGEEFRMDRKKGVCMSHKKIVQDAKDCGYKQVLIMEDDCCFFGLGAWDYFLEHIPDDYDIYFAMIYVGNIDKDNRITNVFSGMTMYVVNERFYDFFLSLPDSCHIDRELGLYSNRFKFLVCDKFICYQDGSRSDNNMMTCDYSSYLAGRKIYGKE